ncbi:hypothetical protein H4W23_25285 [Streptomyces gardneri]|uniref:hypothetical protein n=1 Tax=Streptomyces gardneri TaxID=66892 RepID=UPI0006BDFBBB|nr:hypothetical protein [Streptomyces gardneri]QPK47618.1 hypothetical protein H4W23_25285 [Streptomyces gardneri]WRK39060.1 hypothetical protein U0M97_25395 [Streptomyces venezuelae]CUM38893.1 Proline-rich protein [Streptomyces venezuelae]
MNRPAPLRSPASATSPASPVVLLTVLALVCGALAAVLALAVPAKAATVHGTFTLQGASGSTTAETFATGVGTPAACPAPADPAKPYVKARLAVIDSATGGIAVLADTVATGSLSDGPFTRALDVQADHSSLQAALRTFLPEGPLDGRYELRLFCRTAVGAETEQYFSSMIEVTGEAWAPIAQLTTLLEVVSDPEVPTAGGQATLTATVQPKDAAGSVTFQKFVNEELIDIATVAVVGGKAETTLTELAATGNDSLPVLVTFTPVDPEAHTAGSFVLSLVVVEPTTTPTPTGTGTPTPTGTGTPTGTATPTPTDDPTGTDSPTPTDTPSETGTPSGTPSGTPTDTASPSGTGTGTPAPTGTDDSAGSGGSSGGDSGSSGGGTSGGSGTSGSSGGSGNNNTTTNGGSGSLAATGASAASAALGSLALCLLGAAAVLQNRRRKAKAPRP